MNKDEGRLVPTGRDAVPAVASREGRAPGRMITVNGRQHLLEEDSVSHDRLVRLAFPDISATESRSLTVTYQGGPLQASEGLLTQHQRLPIAEGERFVVAQTSAS
jgi:hypothetical protein